jgi:hypothetical protein
LSRKILGYFIAYVFWIIILLVAIIFILMSQNTLLTLAAMYYVDDKFMHEMLVRFFDKAYVFILGVIWLIVMVVVEEAFRTGVRKGVLIQRFTLVFGIELILIFIFDFIMWGLQGWLLAFDRILILTAELILGAGLLYYRKSIMKTKTIRSP